MEIIAGVQEYDVAANWKLMVENSVDDYHLPSTHSTWLNFMANSGVKIEPPKEAGLVLPTKGFAVELGNGHFTTDNVNFRGRPVAKWIPLYGEPAKAEIDDIRSELVTRLGPERATRVADTNRNLVIFPNLVINDGSSVTVRTFYPQGADKMHVTAWALGPVEESESARARRLDAFLTFYGPGGFATPDDVEALELVQQGLANWQRGPLVGNVARHGQGGRAAQQRRAPPAHLLAALERADGSAGMTSWRHAPWSRARRSRISSITRPRCSTNGGSTSGRRCSTDDAAYYVPPNDQLEGDHRSTLFIDRRRPRAHPPAHDPHQRSQLPRRISEIAHPADDLQCAHRRRRGRPGHGRGQFRLLPLPPLRAHPRICRRLPLRAAPAPATASASRNAAC